MIHCKKKKLGTGANKKNNSTLICVQCTNKYNLYSKMIQCKTAEIFALVKIFKIGCDNTDMHVNIGLKVHQGRNMLTLRVFIEQLDSCWEETVL